MGADLPVPRPPLDDTPPRVAPRPERDMRAGDPAGPHEQPGDGDLLMKAVESSADLLRAATFADGQDDSGHVSLRGRGTAHCTLEQAQGNVISSVGAADRRCRGGPDGGPQADGGGRRAEVSGRWAEVGPRRSRDGRRGRLGLRSGPRSGAPGVRWAGRRHHGTGRVSARWRPPRMRVSALARIFRRVLRLPAGRRCVRRRRS